MLQLSHVLFGTISLGLSVEFGSGADIDSSVADSGRAEGGHKRDVKGLSKNRINELIIMRCIMTKH